MQARGLFVWLEARHLRFLSGETLAFPQYAWPTCHPELQEPKDDSQQEPIPLIRLTLNQQSVVNTLDVKGDGHKYITIKTSRGTSRGTDVKGDGHKYITIKGDRAQDKQRRLVSTFDNPAPEMTQIYHFPTSYKIASRFYVTQLRRLKISNPCFNPVIPETENLPISAESTFG